ncbi:MAG: prolyl aminopeptidase [Gammaproteobacteria bacterium]
MASNKPIDSVLYPAIEPHEVAKLAVSDLHTIVYEDVGPRNGRPALFLHGGPGVGIAPDYRRFFDPAHYRQILVDQRGAGRSTPHAEIEDNTTWRIIEDLEALRVKLGFENWVIMGGSWGSLLALCYAIKHPDRVSGIIIRGIFLGRQSEIDWIHAPNGAAQVYPDEWARYKALVPDAIDNVKAYCDLMASDDKETALAAANAWNRWESSMCTVMPDPVALEQATDDHSSLSIGRIESSFTASNFYLESDNHVLDNASKMAHIPMHIINGRFDLICPSMSAWELHNVLPLSKLTIVPDGAHSPLDGGMTAELVRAADEFRKL